MHKIKPGMTNNDIGRIDWTVDKTDHLCCLFRKYAEDLKRVRKSQRSFGNNLLGWRMFDDMDAEVLYLVIRDLKPETLAEVSCGNGWSTSWILNAVKDNGVGCLWSCDVHDTAKKNLPTDLVSKRWKFLLGDVRTKVKDIPSTLDFLMMDSEHSYDFCKWFIGEFFGRVHPGGIIASHDIYMMKTPAHGDAKALFEYVDEIESGLYTPANCFEESFEKLMSVREEIGIPRNDVVFKIKDNSLAFLDV